jgi:hypothetical protein
MPTLNVSSWIDIEMIADGEAEYPNLSCVLIGETQPITTVAGLQRLRIRSLALSIGSLGVVIFTVGFGLLGFQSYSNPNGPTLWPSFLIIIGSLVWLPAGIVYLGARWLDRQERLQAKRISQAPSSEKRISKAPNTQPLLPGMIVSNEPGYYKTGAYGIRIENLVLVVEAPEVAGSEKALNAFETLTLAPIDRRLVRGEMLSAEETAWLDRYHARVHATLSPLLDAATGAWLAATTRPLGQP